mgnify:CR=1 FL=1
MGTFVIRPFEKRFVFSLILVALLAIQFWTQSRYPSLNEKAMMSGAIQLEDPLSFEAKYPLKPEYTTVERIGYSTLNWIETNRKGMTFGILFGAAFLTLMGYVRQHSFKGRFANSLLGMGVGAPLGVCVNCAAPIAKALYSGGARAEATLSAMIASPTLNVVVLTMIFSLMPFYVGVLKVVLSVFVILVAVPVICRFLPENQLKVSSTPEKFLRMPKPAPAETTENLFQSVWRFAWDFAKSLWFIVSRTLPLMLLAGFLGAVVATLVPPETFSGVGFGFVTVFLAAILGTFLPVPIGFDVVVSGALLGGGMDVGLVTTLLFTLGIFSVYSFFIVAGAISLRAASLLAGTIVVIGTLAGIGVHYYHQNLQNRALEILTSFELSLVSSAQAAEPEQVRSLTDGANTITISRRTFEPRSAPGEKRFEKMEAWKLGIDQPIEFSFADMWPPFWEGRGISAGDWDNDGWQDVVVASTVGGLYFYRNTGGKFERSAFDIGEIAKMPVFNVAFVDIDNDGWLDLFFTTFRQGNYVLRNAGGTFAAANMTKVANRDDAVLTLAASFGDVNGDGYLDVAFGNWAAGWYRRIPGDEATNRVVYNKAGALDGSAFSELAGPPGETLSILLTDINVDGKLDLLEGNDFEMPDMFSLGDGAGAFKPIRRQDNLIPMTTQTTMAFKTADLANTGRQDIYVGQIAGRSSGIATKLRTQPLERYCEGIGRESDKAICEKNMAIKQWYKSGHSFDPSNASRCAELPEPDKAECRAMLVKDLAIQSKDPSICDLIAVTQERARQLCEIHFRPVRQPTQAELDEAIPQIQRRNVLLSPKGDGSYEEHAVPAGVEIGGWTWDVKVEDVNNDGWKDIYVLNGTWIPNEISPSKILFMNDGTGKFKEQTVPAGMEDYLITAAAVAIDFDNDGDQDFITVPVNGPPMAYVNGSADGNSIAFEFRDRLGNQFGIGNRLEIKMADGLTQMRELQSGGGFMSFDAPVLHFGTGKAERIESATVHWSTGGKTTIDGGLDAGSLYRIAREGSATR